MQPEVSVVWVTVFVVLFLAAQCVSAESVVVSRGLNPVLDGVLSAGEWDDAVRVTYTSCCDPISVYMKHGSERLYVAFNVPDSTQTGGDFVALSFDVNNDKGSKPQEDDRRMMVWRNGSSEFKQGNGIKWVNVSSDGWSYSFSDVLGGWQVEYSVDYSLLGVYGNPSKVLGVLFNHKDGGNAYWWPSGPPNNPDGYAGLASSDGWSVSSARRRRAEMFVNASGLDNLGACVGVPVVLTVLDDDYDSVERASVDLFYAGEKISDFKTDSGGFFNFTPTAVGEYSLKIEKFRFRDYELSLNASYCSTTSTLTTSSEPEVQSTSTSSTSTIMSFTMPVITTIPKTTSSSTTTVSADSTLNDTLTSNDVHASKSSYMYALAVLAALLLLSLFALHKKLRF